MLLGLYANLWLPKLKSAEQPPHSLDDQRLQLSTQTWSLAAAALNDWFPQTKPVPIISENVCFRRKPPCRFWDQAPTLLVIATECKPAVGSE
jgi:hypothetical protein